MPPIIAWQFLLRAQPVRVSAAGSYWTGDLSAEITAIATAVAFFAIVTAYYARKAFLKQSEEVADQAKVIKDRTLAVERGRPT